MSSTDQLIAEGRRHHQAGNLHAAEQLYRQALEADPNDAEVMYFLGILHSQKGLFEGAVEFLTKASTIDPRKPVYFYALANAYLELGEYDKAASRYRRALKLHPDFVEAHNNLGAALQRGGKLSEAAGAFRQALRLQPSYVSALVNLGNVHLALGEFDEAEGCYRKAIEIAPATAEAHNNLGNILQRRGELDEAVRCFTAALDHAPEYVDAMNNLAGAHKARYEPDEAAQWYEKALTLAPKASIVRMNYGATLLDASRTDEAVEQYRIALEHDGDCVEARWRLRLALPGLYERAEQVEQWRQRFGDGLAALIEETPLKDRSAIASARRAASSMTNSFLAYQGRDDLEIQRRYGAFVHEIMAKSEPKWARPRPMHRPGKDGRIRIGFVSAHFRYHAATRSTLSYIRDGDHGKFKYYGYHTNAATDGMTAQFQDACDEWRQVPGDAAAICKRIASDRPHVLIFTDIGMDASITPLAALRLAPVQCTAWGHPVTSGLPTLDCYLSSDLMEPADGEEHYTETLIRLPNLGFAYPRPQMPAQPKTREQLGLPPAGRAVAYLSCQSLYKYLPQHDHVFIEIARRVPEALFVFASARNPSVTEQFRRRVQEAFDEAALDFDRHCLILPRLDPTTDFLALQLAGDVFLDTIGWSGGNTTLEALAAGRPVVTVPGRFMRGRHACAMLKMIGLEEMIAPDKQAYVDLAVRLGSDEAYRQTIARQVRERCEDLFGDLAPVRALEEHIRRWVEEG